MTKTFFTHAALIATVISLTACSNMNSREQKLLSGAAIGTGVGAAAGAVTGGSIGTGALIGAGVGTAAGAVAGRND